MEPIVVNIADFKVAKNPAILATHSLGSCVGVALYDPLNKIGGLAHIMLPRPKVASLEGNMLKYTSISIPQMLERIVSLGGDRKNIVAKIAGGASMFSGAGISDIMQVGAKNIAACKEILAELSVPIIAEDTGKNYGRTLEFHIETGKLIVHSATYGEREL